MPGLDLGFGLDEGKEGASAPEPVPEVKKRRIRTTIVRVPAVWVPNDHRTHAAMIYTLFRNATTTFLPPDPKPEPPHIIMAFDMYKKRDILAHIQRHKEDVPLYGFFTSDEADSAKFITNSEVAYAQMPHAPYVIHVRFSHIYKKKEHYHNKALLFLLLDPIKLFLRLTRPLRTQCSPWSHMGQAMSVQIL